MAEFVRTLAPSEGTHPVVHAAQAHLDFVTIHPFRDGNGRVGRLLMNLLLLRAGYPIAVVPVERRAAYIAALVAAQSGNDVGALLDLVLDAAGASLRDTLAACVGSWSAESKGPDLVTEVRRWLAE